MRQARYFRIAQGHIMCHICLFQVVSSIPGEEKRLSSQFQLSSSHFRTLPASSSSTFRNAVQTARVIKIIYHQNAFSTISLVSCRKKHRNHENRSSHEERRQRRRRVAAKCRQEYQEASPPDVQFGKAEVRDQVEQYHRKSVPFVAQEAEGLLCDSVIR